MAFQVPACVVALLALASAACGGQVEPPVREEGMGVDSGAADAGVDASPDVTTDASAGESDDRSSIEAACVADASGTAIELVGCLEYKPMYLALDTDHVYWTEDGRLDAGNLKLVPKTGGSVTVLATGAAGALAVQGGWAYWLDMNAGVLKAPVDGGAPVVLASGSAGSYGLAIAVDGTNVYFPDELHETINAVPIDGGPVAVLATGQHAPRGMAVAAGELYWTTQGNGTVGRVAVSGGQVTTLQTAQDQPVGIALDSKMVYWGTRTTVRAEPLGGGAVLTLASFVDEWPQSLATDSANVYWPTLGAPGAIHSVGLEGGNVTTLATNQQFPAAVAVDDAHVYWVDSNPNAGAIMKSQK